MPSTLQFDQWQNTNGVTYGAVLQSVQATTKFVTQTINSSTPVALNNLSVTITPKSINSKILLIGNVHASWTYVCSMHIYKNGVDIISNHGSNSQSGGGTALWTFYNQAYDIISYSSSPLYVQYYDFPRTTNTLTYQLYSNSGWSGNSYALYINNRSSLDMLGSSYFWAFEIAQ